MFCVKTGFRLLSDAVLCVNSVCSFAEEFSNAQKEYLKLCGQSDIDLIRLSGFSDSMSELKKTLIDLSNYVLKQTDIHNTLALPSFNYLIKNLPDFKVIK